MQLYAEGFIGVVMQAKHESLNAVCKLPLPWFATKASATE
jgi:hypothetical protein